MTADSGAIQKHTRADATLALSSITQAGPRWLLASSEAAPDSSEAKDGPASGGDDAGLGDAARGETDYVRGRLREELKREPTDEEIDEWLREHTEGY